VNARPRRMSLRDEGRSMADRRDSDSLKKLMIVGPDCDCRIGSSSTDPNCRWFRMADNLNTPQIEFCPPSTTQICKRYLISNETNEKEACV